METDDPPGTLDDAGAAALAFGFVHLRRAIRIERDGVKGTDAHAHAAADAAIAAANITATAVAGDQGHLVREPFLHVNPFFRKACRPEGGWSAVSRPADSRLPQWPGPWGWR